MYNFDFNAESAAHEKAKYFGKYPGVVVNNEGDDLKRGELLVCVAGILEEITEECENPTRTSRPDTKNNPVSRAEQRPIVVIAKPCFQPGFFFLPEKDDPIWVEFVCGDINHPVWTGVWYSKNNLLKTAKGNQPEYSDKIIRTKSGHVIELTDTEDEEHILIQHKTGSSIEIDADGNIIIKGKHTSIVSDSISLGSLDKAKEDIVLGNSLKDMLTDLVSILINHTHPTGVGPSGPPVPVPKMSGLNIKLNKILSTQNTTD